MAIRIIVVLRAVGYKCLLCAEAPITDTRTRDGKLLTVPDVEAAVVFDCFVVAPFCVVVEDKATSFRDCANVSGHDFCGLALRHSVEK
jgi:hypothetical protein